MRFYLIFFNSLWDIVLEEEISFARDITVSIIAFFYRIPDIGIMVRVFANGPGGLGSISRSSHIKDFKNGT